MGMQAYGRHGREDWIIDVTKVGKSKITHVIPYTYLKLWRSKNPIKKEGDEK